MLLQARSDERGHENGQCFHADGTRDMQMLGCAAVWADAEQAERRAERRADVESELRLRELDNRLAMEREAQAAKFAAERATAERADAREQRQEERAAAEAERQRSEPWLLTQYVTGVAVAVAFVAEKLNGIRRDAAAAKQAEQGAQLAAADARLADAKVKLVTEQLRQLQLRRDAADDGDDDDDGEGFAIGRGSLRSGQRARQQAERGGLNPSARSGSRRGAR